MTTDMVIENLKECADYLKSNKLSLSWEKLEEGTLKGGQKLFTAETWNAFLKEFNNSNGGKSVGSKEFQVATIRWIRNQQELLLKAVLSEEFKGKENILKAIVDEDEMKNFFVDAWISKEYLPLTVEDFTAFVKELAAGQELFLQSVPVQWSSKDLVEQAFIKAGKSSWNQLRMIGFDFKNTVANFFSMTKGRSGQLLDMIWEVFQEDSEGVERVLLENLTRGFYENQSRTRQQVTPRIFFSIFVHSDELGMQKNKKDLSTVEKRLVDEFLLNEMETGMRSVVEMYRSFARALVKKNVTFFKLLPVKLQFPAIKTKVLIASSLVLLVKKKGESFRPVKVLGIRGVD